MCVLVGGGSAHSLSHVSVYRGASRQLLSGECPHISALFFQSLLVLACIFISITVTSASLCTSRSLRGALLLLFFYYHLAVTSDKDFFFFFLVQSVQYRFKINSRQNFNHSCEFLIELFGVSVSK